MSMKVALVTGGSRGLGRGVSLRLASEGYEVVVNYLKNEKEAEGLLGLLGPGSMAFRADVGDHAQTGRMAAAVIERYGRLDVLINNAGITRDNLLIKTSEEDWDFVMRTNLKGCFNAIRALCPIMMNSGGGHVVNVSSYSGLKGGVGQAAYGASKAALFGLTRVAAKELGVYNIKVNAVLPGYMPTDMGMEAEAAALRASHESLLGRLSDVRDIAGFIACLIRTEGITGQVFPLESRVV